MNTSNYFYQTFFYERFLDWHNTRFNGLTHIFLDLWGDCYYLPKYHASRKYYKTKRDKIRNEVIRDMAGAKPVLQHIKQQQVKWFGHITRMSINQPALRAYNTKYSGWRARGRPRKRWSDSVADTLKIQGMTLLQATHLAADRQLCPPVKPIGTSGRKK